MVQYVVLKPLNLKGVRRKIGEVLPGGVADNKAAEMLIRSGYIAEIGNGTYEIAGVANKESMVTIPIDSEKDFVEMKTGIQNVITALIIMQKAVDEAVKAIAWVNEPDTLILLNACDSRKGVKKAAEERNVQLSTMGEVKKAREESAGDA